MSQYHQVQRSLVIEEKQCAFAGVVSAMVARQFQALRFATQRRHGLAKFHITEGPTAATVRVRARCIVTGEKLARLVGGHFEEVARICRRFHSSTTLRYRSRRNLDSEIDVAEEMHLDVPNPFPPTGRAAPSPRIKLNVPAVYCALSPPCCAAKSLRNRIETRQRTGWIERVVRASRADWSHITMSSSLMPDNGSMRRRFSGLVL